MNKPIILIGAGGHAKVLIDCMKKLRLEILGAVSLTGKEPSILGVSILGDDSVVFQHDPSDIYIVNGIGMLPGKTSSLRQEAFLHFKEAGYSFLTLVHPSAVIGLDVSLGEGVQVMAGSVIQSSVHVKENTIINTRASIDHDCMIDKHCHIAPGVVLSGHVSIKDSVHIGTGASIIQGVTIGENSVIAAGAVVYKNIPANTKYIA